MAVTDSDIEIRLSTQSATAGDDEASTPAESIGGYMSTTVPTDASVENLFPNVSREAAGTGVVDYRCLFIVNTHESDTLHDTVVWIGGQEPGGGDITIGLDPAGVVPGDDSDPQAAMPADEFTAPDGVAFSNASTMDDGLEIGDLGPGECIAVWLRRSVPANARAVNGDYAELMVDGGTDP